MDEMLNAAVVPAETQLRFGWRCEHRRSNCFAALRASKDGCMQNRPSPFETPRKNAAPQDEGIPANLLRKRLQP